MKGFINAVGARDSLGQDRLADIRGLVEFGGKPVVQHTLDKLMETEVQQVLVLTNPQHQPAYEQACAGYPVHVQAYDGPNPLVVYCAGLTMLKGDDVLAVADDEIFDFSLAGFVERFRQADDNVIAVIDPESIDADITGLNLGRCEVGCDGKLEAASLSFAPETAMEQGYVLLGIYLVHERRIEELQHTEISPANWYNTFHAWQAEGFWADIGKPPLRELAEDYFGISG